jgi:proteasome lid subunit RPN8/RPN11
MLRKNSAFEQAFSTSVPSSTVLTLHLTDEQLQAIQYHAECTYPNECCGLLLGRLENGCKVVQRVQATQNAWDSETAELMDVEPLFTKTRRYSIAPEEMLAGMREARRFNLEVIGIYHSHPDAPAVPSECDRRLAWSQYSYLIVSVEAGKAKNLRSWVLDNQSQFQPEEIAIEKIKN